MRALADALEYLCNGSGDAPVTPAGASGSAAAPEPEMRNGSDAGEVTFMVAGALLGCMHFYFQS